MMSDADYDMLMFESACRICEYMEGVYALSILNDTRYWNWWRKVWEGYTTEFAAAMRQGQYTAIGRRELIHLFERKLKPESLVKSAGFETSFASVVNLILKPTKSKNHHDERQKHTQTDTKANPAMCRKAK